MKKEDTKNTPKETEEKKVSREISSQEMEQVTGGARLPWKPTGKVYKR